MSTLRFKDTFKRFPEYADAIVALRPGEGFGINMNDYDSLYWDPQNNELPPTEEEVKEKLAELIAEWEVLEYRRERYLEYPSVEEQLAMIWDDINSGRLPGKDTSLWFAHINQIKENHPKPNTGE